MHLLVLDLMCCLVETGMTNGPEIMCSEFFSGVGNIAGLFAENHEEAAVFRHKQRQLDGEY